MIETNRLELSQQHSHAKVVDGVMVFDCPVSKRESVKSVINRYGAACCPDCQATVSRRPVIGPAESYEE